VLPTKVWIKLLTQYAVVLKRGFNYKRFTQECLINFIKYCTDTEMDTNKKTDTKDSDMDKDMDTDMGRDMELEYFC
jgi:hypothetical protein